MDGGNDQIINYDLCDHQVSEAKADAPRPKPTFDEPVAKNGRSRGKNGWQDSLPIVVVDDLSTVISLDSRDRSESAEDGVKPKHKDQSLHG